MSKVKDGGMAAVIGMEPEIILETLGKASIYSIDIANFNSPQQIVISGIKDDILNCRELLEEAGARMVLPLNVSGAFHSRYMKDAQEEFEDFVTSITFNEPEIPVIANFTAEPYTHETLKENIVQQISNSVKWTQTIQFLKKQPDADFEEIGPGKVLTRLLKQIQ